MAEVLCPGRLVEWAWFPGEVQLVPGAGETYAVRHARPQTGLPQIISIQLPLPLPPPPSLFPSS